MSKKHEQFLLQCELAKAMLMRVWIKGIITDYEKDRALEILTKKLKHEEDKKSIKNRVQVLLWALKFLILYQSNLSAP